MLVYSDFFPSIATLRTLKATTPVKYAPENEDELEMTGIFKISFLFKINIAVYFAIYSPRSLFLLKIKQIIIEHSTALWYVLEAFRCE